MNVITKITRNVKEKCIGRTKIHEHDVELDEIVKTLEQAKSRGVTQVNTVLQYRGKDKTMQTGSIENALGLLEYHFLNGNTYRARITVFQGKNDKSTYIDTESFLSNWRGKRLTDTYLKYVSGQIQYVSPL